MLTAVPGARLGSSWPIHRHVVGVRNVAATTGPLSPNCTLTELRVRCACVWVNCTEMLPVTSKFRGTSAPEPGVAIWTNSWDIACSFAVRTRQCVATGAVATGALTTPMTGGRDRPDVGLWTAGG